nr:hypothetical protein [Tanacetum cinerariifolium]
MPKDGRRTRTSHGREDHPPSNTSTGSVETTSQGQKEGRWQTDKAKEPDDTIQPPPNPLRKTLKHMKKLRERTHTLKGRSKASLQKKWSFMMTIRTKLHDQNFPLHCRTQTQDVPSHRAEGAMEIEHGSK